MYPLLLATLYSKAPMDFPDFNYPEEVRRTGFVHIPLLSYCRKQALDAIKETGALADIDRDAACMIRWRASVSTRGSGLLDSNEARLELFSDNDDRSLRLLYSAPLCGPEFDALPLVLRLGIEMLIRKECRGSDPE